MEEDAQSSQISVEILVHASARDTHAEDATYRKQATALLDYLNGRSGQRGAVQDWSQPPILVQQTPAAAKILVPESKSVPKTKTVKDSVNFLTIAESILVSAETSGANPDDSVKRKVENMTRIVPARSFESATSSTASIGEATQILRSSPKQKPRKHASRKVVSANSASYEGLTALSNATLSTASVISPDSTKFALQSPYTYQVRKRELNIPADGFRSVVSRMALAEQSPNKRREQSIALDKAALPIDAAEPSAAIAAPQLHPAGWLSSIAHLTSSSSVGSIPKPLPSTETISSKPDNAFKAPWPSSGHDPYTTHLVGILELVAANKRLCAAYRPKVVKRKIESLERGYWHLRIPYSWSSADQERFWKMLEEMIVEGKCGWGNWVEHITDALNTVGSMEVSKGSQGEQAQTHVSEIKVWCWGEVVREIWLSLLMASRRQTLRLGMAWYDSCGKIVVQMR